jgi:MOSC domain-containing protein YiiM
MVKPGMVIAVAKSTGHHFSKQPEPSIEILEGLGVAEDCHAGVTVKHRSRVARDPTQPNLRQVHLIHSELLDELRAQGHHLQPGELGENITTKGIDLLGLPPDTVLRIGTNVALQLTGLRNPCDQIENFQTHLLSKVLVKTSDGKLIRKTGVMTIVLRGGPVAPGDKIDIVLPPEPHRVLEKV